LKFDPLKNGPLHVDGLATWFGPQDEDPPVCPICGSNENVEHDNGEWRCNNCSHIIR